MDRVLIAFVTHSGSTRETAEAMRDAFVSLGHEVDVRPIAEVTDLSPYDLIVAGGLLYRFGWHPDIVGFLSSRQAELAAKRVAVFVTGLRVVKTPLCDEPPCPLFIDPSMLVQPATPGRVGPLERLSTMEGYLRQALPAIAGIRPLSLGFFSGKLDLDVLGLPERLIMRLLMLLTGIRQGDHRNWEAIGGWVSQVHAAAQRGAPLGA
jgi:menaquinone-dependent protoporphyrinogen oxidase